SDPRPLTSAMPVSSAWATRRQIESRLEISADEISCRNPRRRSPRHVYSKITHRDSALRLALVLSFYPGFAGPLTRTGRSGVPTRTDDRYGRRYNTNFRNRPNGNFKDAVEWDSGQSFARCRYQSYRIVCAATGERSRTNAPPLPARLFGMAGAREASGSQ